MSWGSVARGAGGRWLGSGSATAHPPDESGPPPPVLASYVRVGVASTGEESVEELDVAEGDEVSAGVPVGEGVPDGVSEGVLDGVPEGAPEGVLDGAPGYDGAGLSETGGSGGEPDGEPLAEPGELSGGVDWAVLGRPAVLPAGCALLLVPPITGPALPDVVVVDDPQ